MANHLSLAIFQSIIPEYSKPFPATEGKLCHSFYGSEMFSGGEKNVPSNDQRVYFWRETNMKFCSLTPLVFLSTNHLDSEGSHKHHLGLLNISFSIMYGCTLVSQTNTGLYFRVSV